MRWKVFWIGGIVTLPVLILLGIGLGFDPRTIDSPLIGKEAPHFVLEDLEGNRVRLEELKGQPVVLNFWATWCRPCIAEHPVFLSAARRYDGRVAFLGVIYQDETRKIRNFVAQRGIWGPTLVDDEAAVAVAYGVYGVPETYIIDAEGKVSHKYTGPVLDQQEFFNRLEGLL